MESHGNASPEGKGLRFLTDLHSYTKYSTIAVENEVADNMYQRSKLDYLIYNEPIAYADLILNGNPEACLRAVTEYNPLDLHMLQGNLGAFFQNVYTLMR